MSALHRDTAGRIRMPGSYINFASECSKKDKGGIRGGIYHAAGTTWLESSILSGLPSFEHAVMKLLSEVRRGL